MYNLIKKTVCCPGVSGREKTISAFIAGEIAPYADEIRNDAMGNLIALKKGCGKNDKKKIMLCAHMDEIGFMVTFIEKSGLLRIAPIGGINFAAAAYTQVVFANGVKGVIVPDSGVKPADYTADKFGIDIGASSGAEASRRVKIGDTCALVQTVTRLGKNRITGRPLDDRVGCAVIIEIAKRLSEKAPKDDIYYVFAVQEEVGLRGSQTAGFAVAPDICLVYDVTGTGDTAGAAPMECALGKGAAVKYRDSSVICDQVLCDRLLSLAREKEIPAQIEILLYGGTDTASIQRAGSGCTAGALSIPTRYIHSGVEMIDMRDVESCVALTEAFILTSDGKA